MAVHRILFQAIFFLLFVACMIFESHAQNQAVDSAVSEILKMTEKINHDNTMLFLLSFIIGGAIAGVALYGTMLNAKMTRKSMEHNLRPILARMIVIKEKTYRITPFRTKSGMEVRSDSSNRKITLKFKNVGTVPAVNVKKYSRRLVMGDDRHKNLAKSDKFKVLKSVEYVSRPMRSIAPQEFMYVYISLDESELNKILDTDEFYFELKLEYGRPDSKKKYTYMIIGHFNEGTMIIHDVDLT